MNSLQHRERGAALIVSLIMLMLITLLAVASFRLGKSNLQIVGNMQYRSNGLAAAQGAVEQVISNSTFTTTPSNSIPNPCNGFNTTCTDVNGDAQPDITVTVNPRCISNYFIPSNQLNFYIASGQGCTSSDPGNHGMQGADNGNSLCSATLWDVQASAIDAGTAAQYTVDEGIAVVGNQCP